MGWIPWSSVEPDSTCWVRQPMPENSCRGYQDIESPATRGGQEGMCSCRSSWLWTSLSIVNFALATEQNPGSLSIYAVGFVITERVERGRHTAMRVISRDEAGQDFGQGSASRLDYTGASTCTSNPTILEPDQRLTDRVDCWHGPLIGQFGDYRRSTAANRKSRL